jgi:hypothetical protein
MINQLILSAEILGVFLKNQAKHKYITLENWYFFLCYRRWYIYIHMYVYVCHMWHVRGRGKVHTGL